MAQTAANRWLAKNSTLGSGCCASADLRYEHKQRVLRSTLVLVCVHLQRGVLWFNVTDNILSVTSNYIFLMLPMVNVESSTYEGRSMPLLPHTLHADEGS